MYLLVASIVLQFFTGVSSFSCPLPQAVFPPPVINQSDPLLKQLQANLTEYFNAGIALDPNTTSVSMVITSSDQIFWEQHHTASLLSNDSVKDVNKHSVYRIASISKVFAVAAGLQLGWTGQEIISDLVPELRRNVKGGPKWDQITVGMLAGQTSGLQRDWSLFDLKSNDISGLLGVLAPLVPPVSDDYAPCGRNETDRVCSRKDFFDGVRGQAPVFEPGYSTSYSNIAYNILGYAVETATKSSWESVLKRSLFSPLNMKRTTSRFPKSGGVIPASPNYFYLDAGSYFATGGLYSTPNDLTLFVQSLLKLKVPLLTPGRVRTWLAPTGFTATGSSAQGSPWEIMRPLGITSDNRRVTVYTKNGALVGYDSIIAIVPELNLGWTILTAGLPYQQAYAQAAGVLVIQGLDNIARQQTKDSFAGQYTGDKGQAKVILAVDDGPGLKITNWVNRGADVLATLGLLSRGKVDARLFPTKIGGGREKWRLYFELEAGAKLSKRGPQVSLSKGVLNEIDGWSLRMGGFGGSMGGHETESACITDADGVHYGGKAINEFTFTLDGKGKAVGVELAGLRVKLTKA